MLIMTNPGTVESVVSAVPFQVPLLIVGIVIASIGIAIGVTIENNWPRQMWMAWTLVIIGGAGLLLSLGGYMFAVDDARSAHSEQVREWLADEFSIQVTSEEAATLDSGGTLIAKLDGSYQEVELVGAVDNTLLVRVVSGEILSPRG